MKIKEIRTQAKQFVMVNKLNPLVLYAVILAVVAIYALITYVVPWFGLAFIPLYFLYAPVAFSSADYYMRSYNLKTEENFKLFEGFKRENFFRALLLSLIRTGFGLCFFIPAVIGVMLGVFGALTLGGSLLFCLVSLLAVAVPALIYFSRSSMAFYLLRMDSKLSAWGAFASSFKITEKKTLKAILVWASYLGWFSLALVAGLGLIYAMPHYQTAKSILFRRDILELADGEELPAYADLAEKKGLSKISKTLDSETADEQKAQKAGQKSPPNKHHKDYKRPVIPDEEKARFGVEEKGIRDMIHRPRKKHQSDDIPVVYTKDNPPSKEFEIRPHETFNEYRARVKRLRAEQREALKLKPPPISDEKETPESRAARLAQDAALEEYYKTDEEVAEVVLQQIEEKARDFSYSVPKMPDSEEEQVDFESLFKAEPENAEYAEPPEIPLESLHIEPDPVPEPELTLKPSFEDHFESKKKAAAEKIAKMQEEIKLKSRTISGDRPAPIAQEPPPEEEPPPPEPASGARKAAALDALKNQRAQRLKTQEKTAIDAAQARPSREEILERILKERKKK
ncbi:MAG: DUF975 family protein [Firmicutes bacterium]|nr:DUF975 family protein [Bacillota bacterium]